MCRLEIEVSIREREIADQRKMGAMRKGVRVLMKSEGDERKRNRRVVDFRASRDAFK